MAAITRRFALPAVRSPSRFNRTTSEDYSRARAIVCTCRRTEVVFTVLLFSNYQHARGALKTSTCTRGGKPFVFWFSRPSRKDERRSNDSPTMENSPRAVKCVSNGETITAGMIVTQETLK